MPDEIAVFLYKLSYMFLPVLFAITVPVIVTCHVALRCGDSGPLLLDRLSLNPLRHIDPFGTVIIPVLSFFAVGLAFGWAKPAPVDFEREDAEPRHLLLTAVAAPGANLLMGLASALLLHLTGILPDLVGKWLSLSLQVSLFVNIFYFVFSLFPIPPLCGGWIAAILLPETLGRQLVKLAPIGLQLIILIFFMGPYVAGLAGITVKPLQTFVLDPAWAIVKLILTLTGLQ